MERNKDNQSSSLFQKLSRSRVFFALELFFSITIGLVLVFPVMAILFCLNELLRQTVKLSLWLVYGDKIQLSNDEVGSNYALMMGRSTERHNVLYLGEVEGTLDVESLRENYAKRVISNKTYNKLTYTWHRKWFYVCLKKCDTFDIRNHIRYYPGTEDRVVTESEVMQEILPDLSGAMQDQTKPQWEEVIIPYYRSSSNSNEKTQSLRIIRIHHSYMDGACTLLMIANTFCEEGAEFPFVIDPCKPLKISRTSMILYKLASLALFTSSMFQNMLSPPFVRSHKSRFSVKHSVHKRPIFGRTKKIPIKYFQSIKDKTGVSMSAIVSAVLSGAIRNLEVNFSEKHYHEGKIPESHPLWMVVGMFPYTPDKMCNNHLAIESHVNITDIPGCERLTDIHDELGRLAKNPLVNVYFWYLKLIGRAPYFFSQMILKLASVPVLLSNIPLSTKPVKLWNKKCNTIVGWVPLMAKTGLGIVSVRYADHFAYCVQADPDILSKEELTYFISQLEKQVEELACETSQLQRKISTDASLFRHEKEFGQRKRQTSFTDAEEEELSDTEVKEFQDSEHKANNSSKKHYSFFHNYIKTNNNNDAINFNNEVGNGSVTSLNYSFFAKFKDSMEQIREGIRKIKEQ